MPAKPSKPYANAADRLPPDLLKQVQQYHQGLLWIPAADTFYHERQQLVQSLKQQGLPTQDIAALAGITPRRVNQLVAKVNLSKKSTIHTSTDTSS